MAADSECVAGLIQHNAHTRERSVDENSTSLASTIVVGRNHLPGTTALLYDFQVAEVAC